MPPSSTDNGQLPVAAFDLLGQLELDLKRAGIAGLGVLLENGLAVDAWR